MKELPYPHNPCARCSVELGPEPPQHLHCGQCLLQPPNFDACVPLLQYEYPAIELISSFKFHAGFVEGIALIELLADTIAIYLQSRKKPQLLIPVPLHKTRLRERGFNQSLEIARRIGSRNGITVASTICTRTKATPSQKDLSALERSQNLKDAFAVSISAMPAHATHVAIIDDVVTTMTTVNCIATLLKSAGAERVDVYCLARVSPR